MVPGQSKYLEYMWDCEVSYYTMKSIAPDKNGYLKNIFPISP